MRAAGVAAVLVTLFGESWAFLHPQTPALSSAFKPSLWPSTACSSSHLQRSMVPSSGVESTSTPSVKKGAAEKSAGLAEEMNLTLRDLKEKTSLARSSSVISVRVRHLLVETEQLCDSLFAEIKKGRDFQTLASAVTACSFTREAGGDVGWVSPADDFLDTILPLEARKAALARKPGDTFKCKTERGFHLIKIEDVLFDLSYTSRQVGRLGGKGVRTAPLREIMDASESEPLTYYVETMGCQMNMADSERMAGQLEMLGFKATDARGARKAKVIVVNTCSIRDHAEQKVYSYLGGHINRKRRGETLAIVVAGCVAQQEGQKMAQRFPEIDLVIGPQYANRVGDLLEEVMQGNQVVATDAQHIMEDVTKPRRDSEVNAWVNVIYGCNERCTYCVVPGTRGTEQSRPKESIVREVEELVRQGYREITLLGQNIDAWGRDLSPKQKFSDLLHAVGWVQGVERVRFLTSHPRYMSNGVVDAVAAVPSLCEMFHVPFQSGDDEVLKAMGRGYTVEKYMEVVNRIREKVPDAAISADAIVGFPGETEEQFLNTLRLMEEVKFDVLNTASYSPRPNTPAALYENQVPEDVKADRLQRINRLASQHAMERNQRYLGRVMEVMVEGVYVKDPRMVKGRIRQGRPVLLEGDAEVLKGKLVPVKIEEVKSYILMGSQAGDPR